MCEFCIQLTHYRAGLNPTYRDWLQSSLCECGAPAGAHFSVHPHVLADWVEQRLGVTCVGYTESNVVAPAARAVAARLVHKDLFGN